MATFTTTSLAVGNHTISASYATDGSFNSSSGNLSTNPQVVNQSNSAVAVTSSVNPSVFGQTVTFTATVTPSTATGTVTFKDGSTPLGTVSLSSGTATLPISAMAVGSHTISAVYNGDANFLTSSGNLGTNPQLVNQASTTTSVISSVNPSTFNQWCLASGCSGCAEWLGPGYLHDGFIVRRQPSDYRDLQRRW